jgi:hypothetical protein
MSEVEQPGADAPEQEPIAHEAPQEGVAEGNEAEAPQLSEMEQVASAMGWRDGGGKKTAAEYIRDTAQVNQSLRQKIDRIEKDHAGRYDKLSRMSETALVNQRNNLWQQWEAAKDNAVATGDQDTYRKLNQGQAQAIRAFDERVAPVMRQETEEPQQEEQTPVAPEVEDFAVKNSSWYMKDKAMTAYAIGKLDELEDEFPFISLTKKLAQVEKDVRETFPNKFSSNGSQQTAPSVEGGLRQIRTTRGKGFNELPPEAKTQASKDVKQGLFKDVHAWATEYHSYGDK